MKRLSLVLLALTLAITLSCGDTTNSNQNASNANSNTGQINSKTSGGTPTGGSAVSGLTPGDPSVLTIAVVVCYDANKAVQVRVTDPIYVSPKNNQKVRWCIYNDLDIALTSVTISAFNSGVATETTLCSNTPNLTTSTIPPGNFDAVCTEFCVAAPSPAGTSFQYTVTAKLNNQSDATLLGPRVVIQ